MKKLLAFLSLSFILAISCLSLFAQTEPEPITNFVNWLTRIPELMSTLPGVILSALFLPPIAIGTLNVLKKAYKYLVTVGIMLGLTLMAWLLPFGFIHALPVTAALTLWGLLIIGQVIGYAFMPDTWDRIADKFNWRKPVDTEK